jgi:sulfatase maturation enzyme AslB (radical SAM superfamily)
MSETFCSAFWNHTNIRGGNRVFPCCRYKTAVQIFDGDLGKVLHSKEYESLRSDSLNGIRNSNCEKCYYEESLNKKSTRQWFNENYSGETVELKYLEVGFDNICNLACDGCWEEWSSSWWVKKNPEGKVVEGILSTSDFVNIPETIEKIVFLGGEPLITNRHRKFLQSFSDLSHLTVEYFTNGMFDLTEEDHKLLGKCKSVKFTVSVDGYRELNEKVRTGSEWNKVEQFINTLEYEKVVHTTIHTNNWHGLPDMYDWICLNNYTWTTNVLTYPLHLDIITLIDDKKQNLLRILDSYPIPNVEYIKSHIQ